MQSEVAGLKPLQTVVTKGQASRAAVRGWHEMGTANKQGASQWHFNLRVS
jgi:hypothetical protein